MKYKKKLSPYETMKMEMSIAEKAGWKPKKKKRGIRKIIRQRNPFAHFLG